MRMPLLRGLAGELFGRSPSVEPAAAVETNAEAAGTSDGLVCNRAANSITLGRNITLAGEIHGSGNTIEIADTRSPQTLFVSIHGHDNRIVIGRQSLLTGLRVDIGAQRWACSGARLTIGEVFSIGSRGRFILPNSGNVVEIGDRCMFSKSVVVRGGEYPHLIFDKESGDYLDISDGIFIGDHAWIGEEAYITKGVTVPRECIVGARSVVTRRFELENAVIAGNPAKVVKEGVQWVANEAYLQDHPELRDRFEESALAKLNRQYPAVEPASAAERDDA